MELLGVGPLEFVLIIMIALIVIGPRDLSKTARSAGRFLNRMYKSDTWRAVTQASRNLRNLPSQLAREAEMEELRGARRDLESVAREVKKESRELESAAGEVKKESRELEAGLKAWTSPPAPSIKPPAPADPTEPPGE